MRNSVIFIIILCCIINCKDNRSCKSCYNDNDAHYCSLFSNHRLEDSLLTFIHSIDSIPNPWDILPEYMVLFEKSHSGDTMLIFSCSIEYMPIDEYNRYWNYEKPCQFLLGGLRIQNKNIMVRSDIFIDSILCNNNLDKTLGKQLDSIRQVVYNNPTGWEAPFYRTEKKYKFMYPDSLLLLESYYLGEKMMH